MKKNTGKKNISSGRLVPKNTIATELPKPSGILGLINTHYFFLGVLTLLYLVMLFIVNPIANFPLNDDFVYSRSVLFLVNHGMFKFQPTPAIAIVQVILGALFCLPFGFSFTTLRISTIVLGLVGSFVFYFLIHDLSKNKKLSFLAALLLLVNPIYFNLSNTFMTDVPFLATALFSIFFFFKYISTSQSKFLIAAMVFSVLATLIRQFGVVIPIAFGISAVFKKGQTPLQWLKYFAPALITLIILKIALFWLKYIIGSGSAPPHNVSILSFFNAPAFWSSEILIRSANVLFYFGLLFFPLIVFVKLPSFKNASLFIRLFVIIFLLIITGGFIYLYRGFPTINILNSGYLGPKTLSDVMLFRIPGHDIDHFSNTAFGVIYTFGIAGAILLLINIGGAVIRFRKHFRTAFSSSYSNYHKQFFVAICALGYLLLLFAPFDHFDRYMLPLFPLICLVIISEFQTNYLITVPSSILTCIYVLAILLFSALGTHDYIAWNRARWQAVNYLTKDQNISIHKIDGGYEVNGWLIGMERNENNSLWGFVDDNMYMLSFGEINGCRVVKQFYYQNYFPHTTRCIYVLQTRNK